MEIVKLKGYEEMSQKSSELVIKTIQEIDNPVLGLATGSTPEGMYGELIKAYRKNNVSFQNVTTFNLDEYVGLSGEDSNSYRYYMNEKLFHAVDIPIEHAHVPNGDTKTPEKECAEYEKLIRDVGYADLQILGIGLNGHIGFNEPGTSFDSKTHTIELDESTRQANARFFNSLEEVPTQAITMGIDTIMKSNKILLLVSGEKKAEAVQKLVQGEITEEFPASILQQHTNVVIIGDEAALSKL
ncbi:glucosamine-6-phosphate deaminase [Virgibacillus siamensis]|uniref:glucosamine-6-phosphate deaminase n=1 Tax=Virgibacillus siamensis TaxID=480071 RepID=UPI000985292B|nr:glucosamine-6-phosphate deaminase [Virgibacillus siamensis]